MILSIMSGPKSSAVTLSIFCMLAFVGILVQYYYIYAFQYNGLYHFQVYILQQNAFGGLCNVRERPTCIQGPLYIVSVTVYKGTAPCFSPSDAHSLPEVIVVDMRIRLLVVVHLSASAVGMFSSFTELKKNSCLLNGLHHTRHRCSHLYTRGILSHVFQRHVILHAAASRKTFSHKSLLMLDVN